MLSRLAAAGLLLAAPYAAIAAECPAIAVDGAGSAVVRAHIPDRVPLCYAFVGRAGQRATVEVTTADGMVFGVERVEPDGTASILADGRKSFAFTAEARTYRVLVGAAAAHGDTTREFALTVTLK